MINAIGKIWKNTKCAQDVNLHFIAIGSIRNWIGIREYIKYIALKERKETMQYFRRNVSIWGTFAVHDHFLQVTLASYLNRDNNML